MTVRSPKYEPTDPRRSRDIKEAFESAAREIVIQAVSVGWREAEAALALADAADDYVLFLSQRPRRSHDAANSN